MQEEQENDRSIAILGIVVTVLIVVAWVLTFYLLKDLSFDERGTFGDMFGAVNALFSGFALAGIILTILLQRKELQLQRKELRDTRHEFELQNKTLLNQRFENMFFSLFNHLCEVTDNLRYYSHKSGKSSITEAFEGKMVFSELVRSLRANMNESYPTAIAQESVAEKHFRNLFSSYRETLQPYLGILYRLLAFIDHSEQDITEKYKYAKIIRGYMTDSELVFLRFYWTIPEGSHIKELLKRYNILKHLSLSIRPEFDLQKGILKELVDKYSLTYGQIDLPCVANKFDQLFIDALVDRKEKRLNNMLNISAAFMYVLREDTSLTVRIKLPYEAYQRELLGKLDEVDFEQRISYMKELLKFDFNGLIRDIVHARFITDKYMFYLDQFNDGKPNYRLSTQSYNTHDDSQKVFECTFEFNSIEENMLPLDLDDITRIGNLQPQESLTVRF